MFLVNEHPFTIHLPSIYHEISQDFDPQPWLNIYAGGLEQLAHTPLRHCVPLLCSEPIPESGHVTLTRCSLLGGGEIASLTENMIDDRQVDIQDDLRVKVYY